MLVKLSVKDVMVGHPHHTYFKGAEFNSSDIFYINRSYNENLYPYNKTNYYLVISKNGCQAAYYLSRDGYIKIQKIMKEKK